MKIFSNVASMKLASLKAGQLVECKGYYEAGDVEGLRYLLKDSGTADGYVDHTLANGVIAELQYSGALNVKWVGAKGDGVTDDTAALVAWAVAADDKAFASGDFLVSGSTVVFDSKSGLLVDLTGATFTQQNNFSKTITIKDSSNVTIINGSFVGRGGAAGEYNGASTSYNGVAGIYLDTVDGIEISGCELSEHAGGSIVWRETDNINIHDNTVTGIGSTYISSGDNGQDFGIGGYSDDATRMDFTASIRNNDISEVAFGIFNNRCTSCLIDGNIIHNIRGQHGIYTIECSGLIVSNNIINNCAQMAGKMQLEAYADNSLAPAGTLDHEGVSFIDNVVIDCRDGFSVLSTTAADSSDQIVTGVVVQGNSINNCGQDGLVIERCVDAVIENNNINTVARNGIHFQNSSGRLAGNNTLDCGTHGFNLSFYGDTTIDRNTIRNSGVGASEYPIFSDTAVSAPSTKDSAPVILVSNNNIYFDTGDASAYLMFFAGAAESYKFYGNKTNSEKTVRASGTLIACGQNEFRGFYAGAQNSPAAFIYGRGRRDFHGQQDPATAASTAYYYKGDVCWNTNVTSGAHVGWVCTTSGAPGTWNTFGVIS